MATNDRKLTKPDLTMLGPQMQEIATIVYNLFDSERELSDKVTALQSLAFSGVKLYDTTATGLSETVWNQYFAIPSTVEGESMHIYKNNMGSALFYKTVPSVDAITIAAQNAAQEAMDALDAINSKFTVSTDMPSGGNEGDVWFKIE